MKKKPRFNIAKIYAFQRKFVKDRDWDQFHSPKNLSMALAGEAGELVELFQWLTMEESFLITKNKEKAKSLRNELADILFYTLRIADRLNIDLEAAMWEKLKQNTKRYPVKLARGNAKKYTELVNQK